MTDHDKVLRQHMTMKLFNFYLDDLTKLRVLQKLKELGLDTKKGTMSALIRVMLNYFADLINDDPTLEYILKRIGEEYILTTTKNKRSNL